MRSRTVLVGALVAAVAAVISIIALSRGGALREPVTVLEKGLIRVKAGDSLLYDGKEIRLLGIDAPEMESDHFSGDQEPYASEAKRFLETLIDTGHDFRLHRHAEVDKYNRILGYLLVDGRNISAEIVKNGHAYESISYYGYQGFVGYASEVMRAAEHALKPPFEQPVEFRKRAKALRVDKK